MPMLAKYAWGIKTESLLSESHSCLLISSYKSERPVLEKSKNKTLQTAACILRTAVAWDEWSWNTFVELRGVIQHLLDLGNKTIEFQRWGYWLFPPTLDFRPAFEKSTQRETLRSSSQEEMRRKVSMGTGGPNLAGIRKSRGQSRISAGAVSQSSLMTPDFLPFTLSPCYFAITVPLFSHERLNVCFYL